MSMTEIIEEMTHEMAGESDFPYMNKPVPPDGQAYIQRDYKTGQDWVHCCWCGKKQFPLTPGAKIQGQKFKCKGSNCKREFEINV